MPQLSWNEIQKRALEFSSEWEGETYEKGESQSFWSDFLSVFGIERRRHGAYFEYAVKKINNRQGFIDMFWPGILLAEQKSAGRDLSAANTQAFDYLHNLSDEDLPQYIVVSDFANFELVNLETRERTTFKLKDFPKKVKLFGFLIGRYSTNLQEEDPVNRKAAESMAALHNQLSDSNYKGHDLELLLVRLVFCLFADDAGIFERGVFQQYLENRTAIDGSNLGPILGKTFEVLNTPQANRQANLDDDLASLPYVNGGLFAEMTRMPDFSGSMREELLDASRLDWSLVSPAIFGSMFQGVMSEETRRNLGAHYTSERNILKVIKGLFLDNLYAEFHLIKHSRSKLAAFHDKIASLTFLDPACGCGNFLVITYRELRKLEHQVLMTIHGKQSLLTDVTDSLKVSVDQMNGIELKEFPALIAETALWLTDHQMNLAASQQFGRHYVRLPLKAKANIHNVDALEVNWNNVAKAERLNYILGNPPFSGSKYMSVDQRAQVVHMFKGVPGSGTLDYVAAWYAKSAEYMKNNRAIQAALVSTNSITQGEQVGTLWSWLLEKGIQINFAHQTFKWKNEGKNVAAVYCIIVGFSYTGVSNKQLYIYEDIAGEPIELAAKNVNPYLVDAPNALARSRSRPISQVPDIGIGNKPIDGGFFLFSEQEKDEFVTAEPNAEKYFKKWIGSHEFINRYYRWVLWLGDAEPNELRQLPLVLDRIEKVRRFRLESKSAPTNALAATPTRFHVENIPNENYLVIPEVSSEKRAYIPIGYMTPDYMPSNLVKVMRNASKYHFAILTSRMHMAWVRYVCGRLKSDYRYSKDIVFNNFIWPINVTKEQTEHIESLAQEVLSARELYPNSSYSDLYDPRTMPAALSDAHIKLDKAVDSLYSSKSFNNDEERVELLFKQYAKKLNSF
jgi:hypothetical protein